MDPLRCVLASIDARLSALLVHAIVLAILGTTAAAAALVY